MQCPPWLVFWILCTLLGQKKVLFQKVLFPDHMQEAGRAGPHIGRPVSAAKGVRSILLSEAGEEKPSAENRRAGGARVTTPRHSCPEGFCEEAEDYPVGQR